MNEIPQCPDCEQQMEKGFLLDHSRHLTLQAMWHSGDAETSKFFGIELDGRSVEFDYSKTRKVISYRCPHCGLLRSYAE